MQIQADRDVDTERDREGENTEHRYVHPAPSQIPPQNVFLNSSAYQTLLSNLSLENLQNGNKPWSAQLELSCFTVREHLKFPYIFTFFFLAFFT